MAKVAIERSTDQYCLFCECNRPQYPLLQKPTREETVALTQGLDDTCKENRCKDAKGSCLDLGTFVKVGFSSRTIIPFEKIVEAAKLRRPRCEITVKAA